MPYKANKPCAYKGCPKLTANRYCTEHAKHEAKRYNKYDRNPDSNKRYGQAWKQLRELYLSAHPLCEMCKDDGCLREAWLVHHKKPLASGGINEWNNLQALCTECHSRLHASHGDYF